MGGLISLQGVMKVKIAIITSPLSIAPPSAPVGALAKTNSPLPLFSLAQ